MLVSRYCLSVYAAEPFEDINSFCLITSTWCPGYDYGKKYGSSTHKVEYLSRYRTSMKKNIVMSDRRGKGAPQANNKIEGM